MSYFVRTPQQRNYLEKRKSQGITQPNLSIEELKIALIQNGVWPASLPGNMECWYPEVLLYIQGGHFTFEEFINEFSNSSHFDYGETLKRLLETQPQYRGDSLERELH